MHGTGLRRAFVGMGCLAIGLTAVPGNSQHCEAAKFFSSPPPFQQHNLGFSADIEGNVAIAGAYRRDPDGAAYIYERFNGQWALTAELLAPDPGAPFTSEEFGHAVAVSGNTAIVSSIRFPDPERRGIVYVYVRDSAGKWNLQADLMASDSDFTDEFGWSLALEGETLLVSAIGDDDHGQNSGAVYVFTRSGTTWTQQTKITMPGSFGDSGFGVDIALDGDTAIIGAEDYNDYQGEAHIFVRSGSAWLHQATLTASDPEENCAYAETVAIDGDTAIVGAHARNVFWTNSGAAYVYQRSGTTWTQQIRLTQGVEDSLWEDHFGWAVAVSGGIIAVGYLNDDDACPENPLCDSGSVRLFRRDQSAWVDHGDITPHDSVQSQQFGQVVALDGDDLIVGVPGDDEGGGNMGAAYFFAGLLDIDCNQNNTPDGCDIADGTSADLNNNGVPDECEPANPGDINGDGVIDIDDLLIVVGSWGPCPAPPAACPADVVADGDVNIDDLLLVIANWS